MSPLDNPKTGQPVIPNAVSPALLRAGQPLWQQKRIFLLTFGFLSLFVLLFILLSVWAWTGSLEESVPGTGQIVPQAKIRRVMSPIAGVVVKVHVRENQEVKAGQVLVELEPDATLIEKKGFEEQLTLLQQEAHALESASFGSPWQTPPGEYGKVQGAWLNATRQGYMAEQSEAQMRIAEAQFRYKASIERLKQLKETLASSENLLVNYRNLYTEGGLSAKELIEYEQQVTQQRGELATQQETVEAAKSALEQAKARPSILLNNYHQQILSRLADHQQKIAELQAQVEKEHVALRHQVITAPIDGVVNEQVVRGPGDVATPGQPLLSLVPKDARMVAEVKVANRDLSFIHLNQRASLRLDALPYQHFGKLYGTIEAISPSTQAPPAQNSEQSQNAMPYYVLTIRPDKTVMTYQGKSYPLRSGMTLSADIITRKKNILSFFTEPIEQQFDRAFRDPSNR